MGKLRKRTRPGKTAAAGRQVDLRDAECACCYESCPEKLAQPEPSGGEVYCGSCALARSRYGWCPDEEGYCSAATCGAPGSGRQ